MASAATPPEGFLSRRLDNVFEAREQGEGVGARVRRTIGTHWQRNFDPFLMLDEFRAKRPGGFPSHPHRGFETVTYMLSGEMNHEDFKGHRGTIRPGEIQWMSAGKGIIHSEIPGKEEAHGMQLWVNLAAKDKLCEPAYQEGKVESVTKDGITAHVISGSALGLESDVVTRTPVSFIHFEMEPGKTLHQPIPENHNAFVYTLDGEGYFGVVEQEDDGEKKPRTKLPAHYFGSLTRDGKSNGLSVQTKEKSASFILLAGKPLNEPIVQHGPFVMNSASEIQQAIRDYQSASNGFERPQGWTASIDDLLHDF